MRHVRRKRHNSPRILLLWKQWDRTPVMAGRWYRDRIADCMGDERFS